MKKNRVLNIMFLMVICTFLFMNNVHAATLILEKKINNKHKYGYVPNEYRNFNPLTMFFNW